MIGTREFDPFAVSLGISFVPVDATSKKPYHEDWANPEKLFPSDTFKSADNCGGRWGPPSDGLVDIDCDTPEACRIAERVIRKGPRWGRPGKRASHYLVRAPGAKTKRFINPITNKTIIEIRSTGSQSVLPPSRHEAGGQYAWERQEPPMERPPVALDENVAEIAAAAFIASLWKPSSRHQFALALAGFLAKNHASKEQAQRFVEQVTIGAEDNEAADRQRAVADTYDDYAKGEDVSADLTGVLHDDAGVVAKTLGKWLELERDRFHIHDETTLLNRPAAPFLAKDLLVQSSLVALVSPPDIGKTFLALDLMLSVAAGQPKWLGKALRRAGPVLYVIGEGAGRFKLRVLVWKQEHKIHRSLPFYWLDGAVPLLEEKAARAFLRHAAPLKPVVIVFDTLSRCLVGGDENSAKDMGQAMSVCDELRARTKALVVLLHHTKKDGTVERGSSALRGAVDTILTLTEDDDERGLLTLVCERQKDAEPFEPMQIKREVRSIDGVFDDDGNAESSCVIRLATADEQDSGVDKRSLHILNLVRLHPGITKTQVAKELGGRRAKAMDEIDKLIAGNALRVDAGERTAMRLFVVDEPALFDGVIT